MDQLLLSMRRMAWRLALTLPLLGACGGAPSTEPAAAKQGVNSSMKQRLDELAAEIDPGPQQWLHVGMPEWLHGPVGFDQTADVDADALAREAAKALEAWHEIDDATTDDGDRFIERFLVLAGAIVAAERAADAQRPPSTEVLLALDELYGLLDRPGFRRKSPMAALMKWVQQLMSSVAQGAEGEELKRAMMYLTEALERVGPLHHHTAAQLMRQAPDHPEIPAVLARLAESAAEPGKAKRLAKLAVDLRGSGAKAEHFAELASRCFRALDVDCGGQALGQVKERLTAGDPKPDDLDEIREQGEQAKRTRALEGKTELASGLERARLLEQLERRELAHELLTKLQEQHPQDARPLVGMARIAMEGPFDFREAGRLLEQARPLEPKDREFYDLAVGAGALTFFYQVLPKLAAEEPAQIATRLREGLQGLQGDVDTLAKLGSDLGVVLQALLQAFDEVLPLVAAGQLDRARQLAPAALPRTLALRKAVPTSPHAYQLMLVAAPFGTNPVQAFTALAQAPRSSGEHATLALQRVRTFYELVVTWGGPGKLAQLDTAIAELPATVPARARALLRADAAALRARLQNEPAGWTQAAAMYRDLVGDGRSKDTAVILNNLAVCLAETGQAAHAEPTWEQAAALDEEHRVVPLINLYVTRKSAEDYAALEALLAEDDFKHELLVRGWLVQLSDSGRARRKHSQALRQALKTWPDRSIRPRPTSSPAGVHFARTLQFGLGYSSKDKLSFVINAGSVVWLIRPPAERLDVRR